MKISFTAEELLTVAAAFKRIPIQNSPLKSATSVILSARKDRSRIIFQRGTFYVEFSLSGNCESSGACMFSAKELERFKTFFSTDKTLVLVFEHNRLTVTGSTGKKIVLSAEACEVPGEFEKGEILFELNSEDMKFISGLRNDHFVGEQLYFSHGMVWTLDNVHMAIRKINGVVCKDTSFSYAIPDDAERLFYAAELFPGIFRAAKEKTQDNILLFYGDRMTMAFPMKAVDPLHIPNYSKAAIKIDRKDLLKTIKGLSLEKLAYYTEMKTEGDNLSLSYHGTGLIQTQSFAVKEKEKDIDISFDIRFLKRFLALIPSPYVYLGQDRHVLSILSEGEDVMCFFAALKKRENPSF